MKVFTDLQPLFDAVNTSCPMTEKRLLIDIAELRESYAKGELNYGWIQSQYNLADPLTKDMTDSALHRMLKKHKLNTPF